MQADDQEHQERQERGSPAAVRARRARLSANRRDDGGIRSMSPSWSGFILQPCCPNTLVWLAVHPGTPRGLLDSIRLMAVPLMILSELVAHDSGPSVRA
jgi:hypothetical protein